MRSIVIGSDGSLSVVKTVRWTIDLARGEGVPVCAVSAFPRADSLSEPLAGTALPEHLSLVTAAGSPSRGVASKLAHHAPHSVMIMRE